ncbi:hypothetical protein [Emticicia sp. BO119]|uniref:hypothetical protein n=1 Tax=Emticicia sp. BO119 TaxID=2757768 RepID=UPI0015F062EC|nr:hypothetical protein [Emticicia sp. BO119]MBA4849348.1 hypothetical protein [Emticicia sp. BO119]
MIKYRTYASTTTIIGHLKLKKSHSSITVINESSSNKSAVKVTINNYTYLSTTTTVDEAFVLPVSAVVRKKSRH